MRLPLGPRVLQFSLLVFLFASAPAARAQAQAEVRVGLGWLALPQQVTITPRAGGAVMRTCASCPAARMAGSVTFTAQENTLRAAAAKPSAEITIEGDYAAALPGRPPLHSRYPATLRARAGRIRVVLRIPLEDYVVLALAGESADATSEATLQAMAVVVRTYAINQRGRHAAEAFDLCDTTH
ncbi:MAG TPA: SpoIID/LytB domain-containing protein, partial [Candidatus Acidoferrales bacterium]|nr:SpoIID/LytB domain-containing protein [Candidatus Acidoferrales bacterium]